MKVSNTRSPTEEPVKRSKASAAAKKKTYRQRTMQEVKKSLHYVENKYDDQSPENMDPAHKSIDLAVDTARTTGDYVKEQSNPYSSKMKSHAERHGAKASEKLSDTSEASRARNKEFQKKRIKNDYAKATHDAKTGATSTGKATGEVKSTVSKTMEKMGEFISEHPMGVLGGVMVVIVLLTIICSFCSCTMVAGGMGGGGLTGTYTAEDSEIYEAQEMYSAKEASLRNTINNIEYAYPGYDEYNYSCDTIWHSPWELISYLTVKHQDFTATDVSGTINSLFASQYHLDIERVVETRYREEERIGYYAVPVYDEEDGEFLYYEYYEYTYTVQVPYSYYILNVTLENERLGNVIANAGMNPDDTETYNYLQQTKGGKEYLF